MIIETIVMRDFLPYSGENPVFFARDRISNVTVIHGENTKGKTSLLNAFRWVLYGHPMRDGKIIEPKDLLNKEAFQEGRNFFEVELRFSVDSVSYVMNRGARVQSVGDWEVSVSLLEDNVPVPQNQIAKKINSMAPEEVSRFFLFDGELLSKYEDLLDHTSSSAEKIKRSIENVLGVPSLLEAVNSLEDVKSTLRKVANDASKKTQGHEVATSAMETKLQSLEDFRRDKTELEKINENLGRDVEKISEFIDQHEDKFKESQDKSALEGKLEVIEKSIVSKGEEFSMELGSVWGGICAEVLEVELQDQQSDRDELDEQLLTLMSAIETFNDCPICDTHLSSDLKSSIRTKAETLQVSLADTSVQTIRQALKKIKEVGGRSLDDLVRLEKEITELEVDSDTIVDEIKRLTADLQGFAADDVASHYQRRSELNSTINSNREKIDEINASIAGVEKEVRNLEQILKQGGTHESQVAISNADRAGLILNALTQSVDQLRNELRSTVEKKATEAFMNLTSRRSDYRGLSINENYGLEIVNSDGEKVPLRSAGASQVVALSLITGLNQTGKSPGPIIMDTPFGRLDEIHRGNILEYMPKTASQFIVLVHSGEIEESGRLISRIADRIGRTWKIESINASKSLITEVMS
jgi:DNA sulfur modification protein DndD